MELMTNWLTFWGGREPTKTILIPKRIRKRIGEMKRMVLILRRSFLSLGTFKRYYRRKIIPPQLHILNPHSLPTGRRKRRTPLCKRGYLPARSRFGEDRGEIFTTTCLLNYGLLSK
jgi:hypothetical protein